MSMKERFLQSVAQTSNMSFMIEIESASRSTLHLTGGRKMIDFTSGVSVMNMGHSYPPAVKAIQSQAESFLHTQVYGEHVQTPQVEFAEEILKEYGSPGHQVFFVNSGNEANDLALKMARKLTGRKPMLAIEGGFHGRGYGALSVTWNEKYRKDFFTDDSENRWIRRNNIGDIEDIDFTQFAGVILELVQGEAGCIPLDQEFVSFLTHEVHRGGGVVIVDEVQTGFGRTGTFFCQEQYPEAIFDFTTIGKAMGGGLPLGGVIAPMLAFWDLQNPPFSHLTTFGGNPVSCAAGLATMKGIQDFMKSGVYRRNLNILNEFLDRLYTAHPSLLERPSGVGFLRAINFKSPEHAELFVHSCRNLGLQLFFKLNTPTGIRVSPSLNISDFEFQMASKIIHDVLDSLEGRDQSYIDDIKEWNSTRTGICIACWSSISLSVFKNDNVCSELCKDYRDGKISRVRWEGLRASRLVQKEYLK